MITDQFNVSAQGTAQGTISLLLGHPDPATLLTPQMQDAIQSALNRPQAYTALQYSPEQGTRSLITYLVDKINREQRLSLRYENLMLVAGSTHAVDMITRLYARPRGVVIVEGPTYADSLHIFHDHQVELCAIPMDENGVIIPEMERILAGLRSEGKGPAFFYTIPNFHNPTGITTARDRRLDVIRLAREYNFLIVEDDVYRELCFENAVPDSFYSLANGTNVLSIGSFSETPPPCLRLGWLVGADEAIQRFVNCGTTQMGGGASPFTANIVAEFCRKGYLEPHVSDLRALYKRRRDAALSALTQSMPGGVTWTHPGGGFFIWLTLPGHVSAQKVKQIAQQRGGNVAPGEGYFLNPADGSHNLRLAFSFAPPPDIQAAIKILGNVIRELAAGHDD